MFTSQPLSSPPCVQSWQRPPLRRSGMAQLARYCRWAAYTPAAIEARGQMIMWHNAERYVYIYINIYTSGRVAGPRQQGMGCRWANSMHLLFWKDKVRFEDHAILSEILEMQLQYQRQSFFCMEWIKRLKLLVNRKSCTTTSGRSKSGIFENSNQTLHTSPCGN